MNNKLSQLLIITILLHFAPVAHAQLSPADSAFFINIFTFPRYIDDSVTPGNFYKYSNMTSMYEHYLLMDTSFKFKTADLDSIDYLVPGEQLISDTPRNASFAMYPAILSQNDPMVYLPFSFLNKQSYSYSIRYKDTNLTNCRNAFFIIPGNGDHQALELAQGPGYHNQLCQIKNHCINYGDVYAFIKPNQESRAICWNGHRMDDYLLWYLNTAYTPYGINYLIEIIAMVKYLQAHYDKVFIFGLSEGGYATMLTTMYTEPDAAIISGGYSIGLDTNYVENSFLRYRFDYLLDTFNQVKVKSHITASKTNYLFTWGENDPVPTMDPEHDFHYTQNYFGPLPNCSYFYDFYDHTFPPCPVIDTFIQKTLSVPLAHFRITDSTAPDSLFTQVRFCRSGLYHFDLYKDTTFVQNYTMVTDTVNIALTDTGKYYIKNISDSSNINGKCADTIVCNKYATPLSVSMQTAASSFSVQYNNPFYDLLRLKIISNQSGPFTINIFNTFGIPVYRHTEINKQTFGISSITWPPGLYYIHVNQASSGSVQIKLLKL
ncbi:MAG: T9SS type A sorting domain-containing protein [Chitinophagaceae bacterium]|nr:T9SS type A sorting domain-containing protein [Chitinophagaceae bacterium]